jgi:uncharacterized protein (DUF58 family)
MLTQTMRSKIKKIKIYTKRIMQTTLTGDYLSAFKGSGLEFDQLREYQIGDDVRAIDWNSSAKMHKIMVKQYIEERDRTIILAIDVSQSNSYSSTEELRKDYMAEVAASLAFLAADSKDKVGALFFSDRIEKWIPPSRGSAHGSMILETIFSLVPQGKNTDIATALRFLIGLKKRNAIVFCLSDWIDDTTRFSKLLKVAGFEYDFVGLRFLDPCELALPDVGLLEVQDSESGQRYIIDTRKAGTDQHKLSTFLRVRALEQKKLFDKYKIDLLDLPLDQPFIRPLVSFFHKRIRRQI